MMETGKLNEATTQRDSDNYLLDNIRRQYEMAAYLAIRERNNQQLAESYREVERIALKTFKSLKAYEDEVVAVNRKRRENSNSLAFEWMLPSTMQTSLNIW